MAAPGGKRTEGVEVTLNPEELDLDTAAMQAKYDQTMKEQQSQLEKEDLSDMVAEHAAKQKVGWGCVREGRGGGGVREGW